MSVRIHRSPEESVTLGQDRRSLHDLDRLVTDNGTVTVHCSCGWSHTARPFKGRDVGEAAAQAWETHAERKQAG